MKSSLATIRAVRDVLEKAGVEFLNHGQPGVRLRAKPKPLRNDGNPPGHVIDPDEADRIP